MVNYFFRYPFVVPAVNRGPPFESITLHTPIIRTASAVVVETVRHAVSHIMRRVDIWSPTGLPLTVGLAAWGAYIYLQLPTDWTQRLASLALYHFSTTPPLAPEHVRNAFSNTQLPPVHVQANNHTHAYAAADRGRGNTFIRVAAQSLGLTVFMIQKSKANERSHLPGDRVWYWNKDVNTIPDMSTAGPNTLQGIVDTDYHMDMPNMLASRVAPYILYTFQPSQVGGVFDDFSYTFDEDSRVNYLVNGGGTYKHHLWSYQCDHIVTSLKFLGIPYKTTVYNIDRRAAADEHEMVLLTPIRTFGFLGSLLARIFLQGSELKRYDVVRGKSTILQVRSMDGHFVSVGSPNSFLAAKVPVTVYDTLVNLARTAKHELTLPTVQANIGDKATNEADIFANRGMASALLPHLRDLSGKLPDVVYPVKDSVRRYQTGSFEPDAKPSLVPFMSPILHGAYAPDKTYGNEADAVESRITKLQKKNKDLAVSAFDINLIDEFTALLVPVPHLLHPVDVDDVMDRQSTPSQRSILRSAGMLFVSFQRYVKSFVKAEAYAKPNNPRVISTINPATKLSYSRYMYAFSDHALKHQSWYAFGKTPKQVAAAVASKLIYAPSAAMTDFGRFDGTQNVITRQLEIAILTRAFATPYHNEVMELHRSTFNLKGFGREGVKYETGYARNSGVPDTSAFNTVLNAFVVFSARRRQRNPTGEYYSPEEAWTYVNGCFFGGDDGLIADPHPASLTKAAEHLGLDLEIDVIPRGNMGVTFLARIYGPYVWQGEEDSCCDLPRQLAKLHTTTNLPAHVTPLEKLVEKARGYYDSDKHTPLLGPFVSRVMEFAGHVDVSVHTAMVRWQSDVAPSDQYPNNPGDWMLGYAEASLPEFDAKRLLDFLAKATTLSDLLSPPLCQEPTRGVMKSSGVVDDELQLINKPPLPNPNPSPELDGATTLPTPSRRKLKREGRAKQKSDIPPPATLEVKLIPKVFPPPGTQKQTKEKPRTHKSGVAKPTSPERSGPLATSSTPRAASE